jgi:hypothetical protein
MSKFQVDPNIEGYVPNISAVVSLKKRNPEKAIHAAGQMLLFLSDWSEKYPEELTTEFLFGSIDDIKELLRVIGQEGSMYSFGQVLLTRMVSLCKQTKKSEELVKRVMKKIDKWFSKVNNNRTRLSSYDKVSQDIKITMKKVRQSRIMTHSDKVRLRGRLTKLGELLAEKKALKVDKQMRKGRILLKEIDRALDLAEIEDIDDQNIQAIKKMFDEVQLSYVSHLLEDEIDEVYKRLSPYL